MPIFAAIDIGSNSCRLKIASVQQHRLKTLHEDREVTRLGESVFATGVISPETMSVTIKALKRFHKATQMYVVDQVRVVATSAMRDARNAAAFVDGYLRTGDRGTLDADGYLSLIGRIKELINRAGEKISPPEIDAVLFGHPAVAEAASFGVPDDKYGEEISAAVVLKSDASAQDLQAWCGDHLAAFKVPKVFHIVTELPKTATGKVQRSALSAEFARKTK